MTFAGSFEETTELGVLIEPSKISIPSRMVVYRDNAHANISYERATRQRKAYVAA